MEPEDSSYDFEKEVADESEEEEDDIEEKFDILNCQPKALWPTEQKTWAAV